MSNPLKAGQPITVIGCSDMAVTFRREYTVKQPVAEPSPIGFRWKYASVVERGKRKPYDLMVKPGSTLVLRGWNLPVRADSEGGSFRGNALINMIGNVDTIRSLIENEAALPVTDEAKAVCVVWGDPIVDTGTPGVTFTMPSDRCTLLYRELAETRGHAVLDRLIAEMDEEERAECPNCTREVPTGQPFPNYCPVHDGDYSSWLVSNNID